MKDLPPITSAPKAINVFPVMDFPFTSRHTALIEIKKRRKDKALKDTLASHSDGTSLLPKRGAPFAVFFRQVGTPTHETLRFLRTVQNSGLTPVILEYRADKFVSSGNTYKRSLGKMPIYQYTGADGRDMCEYRTVIDFNAWTGKSLGDVTCLNGLNLVDFHHSLLVRLAKVNPRKLCHDASQWFSLHGDRADLYYESLMAHFVRDAILFERFEPSEPENDFVREIMLPAFERVRERYGYAPLVVELVPQEQDTRSFWDLYPKKIEKFIDTP